MAALLLSSPAAAQDRRFTDLSLNASDAIWVRAFNGDNELVDPNSLQRVGPLIIVTDPLGPGVLALNAATGKTAWLYQHRGRGPGEMRQPAIATAIGDSVLVVDNLNRKLYLLGPSGEFIREAPSPRGQFITDLCTLPDSELVVHFTAMIGNQVGRMHDFADQKLTEIPGLPIRDAQHPTSGVFDLTNAGSYGCAAAQKSQEGMVVFDQHGVSHRGDYVEKVTQRKYVPVSELRDTSQLPIPFSLSSTADRGKLYVWFGGTTQCAGRCVDVYQLPSLQYDHTIKFAGRLGIFPRDLIVSDGVLYIMGLRSDDVPMVAAYRLPSPPG